jgi:hypothetical protein
MIGAWASTVFLTPTPGANRSAAVALASGGQLDGERGASGGAGDVDRAAVGRDYGVDDGQSEPGAAVSAGAIAAGVTVSSTSASGGPVTSTSPSAARTRQRGSPPSPGAGCRAHHRRAPQPALPPRNRTAAPVCPCDPEHRPGVTLPSMIRAPRVSTA